MDTREYSRVKMRCRRGLKELDVVFAHYLQHYYLQADDDEKQCLDELLEKSLPDSVEREIEGIVLSFDGVSEPHHLRTRRIGNNYAIEIHIRMDGNISLHKAHETATGIEHRLKEKFGEDTHVGIHVEPVK